MQYCRSAERERGLAYCRRPVCLSLSLSVCIMLGTVRVNGVAVSLFLNDSDARGYRAVAVLSSPHSTVEEEGEEGKTVETVGRGAVAQALVVLSVAYSRVGLLPQTAILGNNYHSLSPPSPDGSGRKLIVDASHTLHGHIVGRGDPNKCYLADVPLKGPTPGLLFDWRKGKEGWSGEEERERVASALRPFIGPRRVLIVRHGETTANKQKIAQGQQSHWDLNPRGCAQASACGRRLRPLLGDVVVVSSPLLRAVHTANIIIRETMLYDVTRSVPVRLVYEPLFMERSFGEYEGLPFAQIKQKFKAWPHCSKNSSVEPLAVMDDRIGRGWEAITGVAADTVILVCHGGVWRSLARILKVRDAPLGNCEVRELRRERESGAWVELRQRAEVEEEGKQ